MSFINITYVFLNFCPLHNVAKRAATLTATVTVMALNTHNVANPAAFATLSGDIMNGYVCPYFVSQ